MIDFIDNVFAFAFLTWSFYFLIHIIKSVIFEDEITAELNKAIERDRLFFADLPVRNGNDNFNKTMNKWRDYYTPLVDGG